MKKKGYQVYSKTIQIRPGKPQRINVTLVRQKRTGKIVIDSIPLGAKIFIKEKLYGKTPMTLELSEGKYLLNLPSIDSIL